MKKLYFQPFLSGVLFIWGNVFANSVIAAESISYSGVPGLDDFPSLHPLIVHLPVVLIPFAFVLMILALVFKKQEYRTIALLSSGGGLLGAYLASYWVHPHVKGLSKQAQEILAFHDQYAYLTFFLSLIGTLLLCLALVLRKKQLSSALRIVLDSATVLFLLLATITVSVAGHFGATLTHLEGVGVQGQFLELDNHGH